MTDPNLNATLLAFFVALLMVAAYQFGRHSVPLRVELVLPQGATLALNGSHSVALAHDGHISVSNGGTKLAPDTMVIPPRPRRMG